MLLQDYNALCQTVLSGTLAYIRPQNMPTRNIDRNTVQNGNAVYKSAVASSAPITIVHTPPGSGKTQILYDRIDALKKIGVPREKILFLNMNIAKSKQVAKEQDCLVMTFSEFTHGIFHANYPDIELSDIDSVTNMLMVSNPDELTQQFITRLNMASPRDKASMSCIWINQNLQKSIDIFHSIRKIDYALESMVCQNMMYRFQNDPYGVTDILINGVHNMPLPILCALLEYANRYHCNVFMTGYAEETIYDFNMAYSKSMDMLSAMLEKYVNIIRLNQTNVLPSILNMLNLSRTTAIDGIEMKAMDIDINESTLDIANKTLTPDATNYITSKLNNGEQILILSRSKSDIADIESVIRTHYPTATICNLTNIQAPHTNYGSVLAKHYNDLLKIFPNTIIVDTMFKMLENALRNLISTRISYHQREAYTADLKNINAFIEKHAAELGGLDAEWNTETLVKKIIQIESDEIQNYMAMIRDTDSANTSSADIVLSTIHSAIDMRYDNVVSLLRCSDREGEDALYHTALSRANKTEYIVFANTKGFHTKYQIYLEPYV